MTETFFITSWGEYERADSDIDSKLYHLAEDVADYGKKFQVNIEVVEIS